MVKKYFGGRAEAKSFAVADHALYGQRRRGAGGAALGAGPRHRAGAGHQRDGRWPAQPGQVHVGPARDARHRPDARGRCARLEAATPCVSSRTAGTPTAWAGPSAWSRGLMPTSRARPATRRTPWRRWCSTWSAPGRVAPRPTLRASKRRRPRRVRRLSGGTASERCGLLLDGRLAVGGLVLVDDALRGSLVELLAGVVGERPWPRRRCRPRQPRGTCARRSSAWTSRPCCARAQRRSDGCA